MGDVLGTLLSAAQNAYVQIFSCVERRCSLPFTGVLSNLSFNLVASLFCLSVLRLLFMHAAGLVHVCHGEPSEFTPLSEWMRQSTMFNMLQSIRFFKCYLHSKVKREGGFTGGIRG